MTKVYLALGGNVGNVINNFQKVIEVLLQNERIKNIESSSIYETKPYGDVEQNNFINSVISFDTDMNLEKLFDYTKNLEKKIGRKKSEVWGPREIDIDILLFGNNIVKNKKVTIPHKDLINRDFVLVPLLELNEELKHPATKKKIKEYLLKLKHNYIVKKLNETILK
ncbi:MAG: 2-amino-4-hydroxy-6-hydroxymethyldihydropteridine diphosphokinase [Ignavibacteriae bacterium]|nr:MAG: 2-amino-4-hydroxy-6-hydroxymethyldihydropteridine diphosphokinase [Ignavibacteriota bacterium]